MIRTRAEAAGTDFRVPFEKFRDPESDKISYASFKQGLDALRFDLSDDEVHALMERFDANGDGLVSFKEFVDAVLGSGAAEADGAARSLPASSEAERALMRRVLFVGEDPRDDPRAGEAALF